jgi:hypothetical protein
MATAIVPVGWYYGSNASGGPVGVGRATASFLELYAPCVEAPRVMWNADCTLHQHGPSQSVFKRSRRPVRSSAHGLRAEQFRPLHLCDRMLS